MTTTTDTRTRSKHDQQIRLQLELAAAQKLRKLPSRPSRPYRERELPTPGEAEGWHGQCRMRGGDSGPRGLLARSAHAPFQSPVGSPRRAAFFILAAHLGCAALSSRRDSGQFHNPLAVSAMVMVLRRGKTGRKAMTSVDHGQADFQGRN